MKPLKEMRLEQERKTVGKMILIYCQGKHDPQNGKMCAECQSLFNYASTRIALCPFGWRKPTCARCTVHCYRPEMRHRIKDVMRYAGPRMLLKHPFLTFMHGIDGLRKST